jgi:hypothetical protein
MAMIRSIWPFAVSIVWLVFLVGVLIAIFASM